MAYKGIGEHPLAAGSVCGGSLMHSVCFVLILYYVFVLFTLLYVFHFIPHPKKWRNRIGTRKTTFPAEHKDLESLGF